MTKFIQLFIIFPFVFLLKKAAKRFSFVIGLTIFICIIIFYSENINNFFSNTSQKELSFSEEDPTNQPKINKIIIKKGDTLGKILWEQNLPRKDVQSLIKLANEKKVTSQLKLGQKFIFEYSIQLIEKDDSDLNEELLVLNRMIFVKDKINSIEFVKQENGFTAHNIKKPLKKIITQYNATISSSFIASLKKAGMNSDSIVRLINAYSHQIDFQRQIRSGDKISVISEKFLTENNEFSHHGRILYACLNSKGTDYKIYRYSPSGKKEDFQFFSEYGQSIKSTLLRTPVKVVRISSHYGYRKKHPVLGYGKMHKGVDFAASIGTPIYASGNGVVSFIGWKSGYGRFILLKHDRTLSTAYAHASKFAKNLRKGSKVKQGDIIAYVGKSGRVTGPHLHYEVRINGKQVNPMKFKSKPGIKLTGKKLDEFKEYKTKMRELSKKLGNDLDLSEEEIKKQKLL